MLTHKQCGMPLETGDSKVFGDNLTGFFCTTCKEVNGEPFEVIEEDDIATVDILKGLYEPTSA